MRGEPRTLDRMKCHREVSGRRFARLRAGCERLGGWRSLSLVMTRTGLIWGLRAPPTRVGGQFVVAPIHPVT